MTKDTKYTCVGKISKYEYLFMLEPYNRPIQFDIYHAGFHADLYCFNSTIDTILSNKAYIKCKRPYRQYLLHLNRCKFKAGMRHRNLLKDIREGVYINYDR